MQRIIFTLAAIFLLLGISFGIAYGATLNMPCAAEEAVEKQLKDRYEEVLLGSGTMGSTTAKVYINRDNNTYTITLVRDDVACLVASGDDWSFGEPLVGDPA